MNNRDILAAAKAAPRKASDLRPFRSAIGLLRSKGYTWREVAAFLRERGVDTDHSAVFRFAKKLKLVGGNTVIPNARDYASALQSIQVSDTQRMMLLAHYAAHNRSITYTELAKAAGYDSHEVANRWYGQLGRDLGEALNFSFEVFESNPDQRFYSSSIGMPDAYSAGPEFKLVMHHELAKAIESLNWH